MSREYLTPAGYVNETDTRQYLNAGGTYVNETSATGAFSISADAGSFSIAGTAASLEYGHRLAADSGSYSISGTAASLEVGREVAADSGSYAISGTAASLLVGREVAADSGSLSIGGTAASLEYGHVIAAAAGAYSISGADATLTHTQPGAYSIAAESGSFSISGTNAELIPPAGAATPGTGGLLLFPGELADNKLRLHYLLPAGYGTILVAGGDVTLKKHLRRDPQLDDEEMIAAVMRLAI
jgi:hypothetical protein